MTHHILRIFTAFALTGIFALSSHGATPEEARQAYDKGDYAKAVEIYQELAKTHGTSSALLFDMGQAYTRAGDLGHGMLCYRRALQQNPSNSQARSNIKYIESRVQDGNTAELKGKKISVVPEDPSFFTVLKNYITRRHHTNTWATWSGITFVLFCVCLALYIFQDRVLLRKIGFFGAIAMISISVLTLIFAFMGAHASGKQNEGVITAYKIELKADPSTSAKNVTSPLVQGTVMQIMDTEKAENGNPQWYKVRLNSDFAGWIRNDSFEPI